MNAKTTAAELSKTTTDHKPAMPNGATTTPQPAASAVQSSAGPIKNASTAISSMTPADMTEAAGKYASSASSAVQTEKKPKAATKMEIASGIYHRMAKQKDVTRKQIVEQFVTEAKLSAAGASTYYQLIKAKLG